MEISTKVTSYKISKRLADLGFDFNNAAIWFYYDFNSKWTLKFNNQHYNPRHIKDEVKAYDLETIIDALPDKIHDKKTSSFEELLELSKDHICYSSELTTYSKFIIWKEENESLVDMASRLLIKLTEDGLTNPNNKEKNE